MTSLSLHHANLLQVYHDDHELIDYNLPSSTIQCSSCCSVHFPARLKLNVTWVSRFDNQLSVPSYHQIWHQSIIDHILRLGDLSSKLRYFIFSMAQRMNFKVRPIMAVWAHSVYLISFSSSYTCTDVSCLYGRISTLEESHLTSLTPTNQILQVFPCPIKTPWTPLVLRPSPRELLALPDFLRSKWKRLRQFLRFRSDSDRICTKPTPKVSEN